MESIEARSTIVCNAELSRQGGTSSKVPAAKSLSPNKDPESAVLTLINRMSSSSTSTITMATTTTSSVATSSSSFPVTISPLNALSTAFPPANLTIHSTASRTDAKDLPQPLPQPNKKQSTPITPLGIIKPIISITPVGSSPSPTNSSSSSKSHSSSMRASEGKSTMSSSSSSNNSQGKGSKPNDRSPRSSSQEATPPNPFMSFVPPLSYLGNGSQASDQSLRALSQELVHHPLAKFFPTPELLCNPFAPKTKCDVSSPHAILSLEKLSKMNERRLRSSQSQDISKTLNRFLPAQPDLLCNPFITKTKNNIPHAALSLVTNGKHERSSDKGPKCSSSGRRKWSPKSGSSDEEKICGSVDRKVVGHHLDNRLHSRSGEQELLMKGLEINSHQGLGVSLSDSITLTPVSPTSPSNAPLNLSLKPAPASETMESPPQTLHSIPQILSYKGAKRGPKPKPIATDDWQKLNQRQEALKAQMEAHLMQQHFKLNKTNVNKAHQGNNSAPIMPPQILIQTKISPDNSIMITTSSNESHKSHHHSSPNSKDSPSLTSRPAISLLPSAGSRFQEFPSTSIHERVPSPRVSSQSPSRAASNGTGTFPLYYSRKDENKDESHTGGDTLEAISTEDDSSGSSEDSESGSETDSSNESDRSSSGSDKSRETTSSKGQKRGSGGDSPPRKRRKYIVSDERELRIPLEHGWRRLTKIRAYSYSGVRGEVIYYGPCGKKLKTYPEVVRYLEKNGIDDITRDNFTFSSKHNVGEFLEPLGNGEYVTIGENEVVSRIEEFRAHKSRRYIPVSERSERSGSRREMRRNHEERMRQLEEARLQQQLEEQAEETALEANRRPENLRRSRRKDPTKQVKELQAAEMRRQREHARFLRMQEKIDRQEQLRVEREVRAQQLLEERKRRQDLLEKQRSEETMRKNKEKESKRLQAVVLKEQERERRRQHMLLVKALEARKRQEERDRMKEEKILEKQMQRERKMEQRQMELQILREMKKPVEDMELKDIEPLPVLDRIPGVKLAGKALADTFMVFEFLHNFGEALGFDMDSLPTLNTLQMAVLNDESCEEELLSLLHHLLICAIEDPGIPMGAKTSTAVGQSLKEMDITSSTISEVLRIYIHANEGEKSPYLEWISRKPFLALNPTQKVAILAYLCNELLCSRTIIRQIDNNIESVNNMRRDRWVVEGKVRNLKLIQTRKLAKQMIKDASKADTKEEDKPKETNEVTADKKSSSSTPGNNEKKEDEAHNDSGNESEISRETTPAVVDNEQLVDQFQGESVEELGKQIDKLVKQQNQFRRKLQKTSQQIRAISFGQDRYRRRYWLLPHAGGVFVEGIESSELAEDLPISAMCANEVKLSSAIKEEKVEKPQVKLEPKEEEVESSKCKSVTGADDKIPEIVKTEATEHSKMDVEQAQSVEHIESKNDSKAVDATKSDSPVNADTHQTKPDDKPSDAKVEENVDVSNSVQRESPVEILPSVPQCHINAEKILKTLEERTLKPWFSILPRMPCDETSLTRIHSLKTLPSPPQASNSLVKHSSETWVPPLSTSQSPHLQFPRSTAVLPQFPSQLPFISGSPMYFHNNHVFMCDSDNFKASAASTSISNELDLLNQLKHSPAEVQPIPQEFQNGWWRISDPNQLRTVHQRLHPRGIREKLLQMKLEKYMDMACEACTKTSQVADLEITDLDREISQKPGGTQVADKENDWSWAMALRVDLAILEQVENLEEKVVNASMQNKHWKLPPKSTEDEDVVFYPACGDPEQCLKRDLKGESHRGKVLRCPLTTARHRLLELEENIERRYIKPPLGYSNSEVSIIHPKHHHNSSLNSTIETSDEKDLDEQTYITEIRDAPEGLLRWRAAVQNARTSSQLAVCLNYLESFIAWDRSIMKACCQFCHCDDNEAMLLLCDGCDKGYHTYCFKPKMETIPDGDWFCFECVNKATGDRVCIVCGKKGKNMCICDSCPKAYHTDCIEPPLARTPKSRWLCPHCKHRTVKGKGKNKKGGGKDVKDGSDSEETPAPKKNDKSSKSEQRAKEKNKNCVSKDLAPCRSLLADLETHEDAWPFLLPVNTKLFPSYRKVIRKPVDLSTIRNKLENGSYKTRSDFMTDVQLIFKNCETFNEDDSPVGKAGHSLRAFFGTRWSELMTENK